MVPAALDDCLTAAHGQLGALAEALAAANLAGMERSAEAMDALVERLQSVGVTGRDQVDGREGAIDEVRWLIERCRRLGRVLGEEAAGTSGYQPDGRSLHQPARIPLLEVKG